MSELVKVTLAAGGRSFSGEVPKAIAEAVAKLVDRAEAAEAARRQAAIASLAADKATALVARARVLAGKGEVEVARRLLAEALQLVPDHHQAAALAAKLAPPPPAKRSKRRKGR